LTSVAMQFCSGLLVWLKFVPGISFRTQQTIQGM
jgi:hypothetical protein